MEKLEKELGLITDIKNFITLLPLEELEKLKTLIDSFKKPFILLPKVEINGIYYSWDPFKFEYELKEKESSSEENVSYDIGEGYYLIKTSSNKDSSSMKFSLKKDGKSTSISIPAYLDIKFMWHGKLFFYNEEDEELEFWMKDPDYGNRWIVQERWSTKKVIKLRNYLILITSAITCSLLDENLKLVPFPDSDQDYANEAQVSDFEGELSDDVCYAEWRDQEIDYPTIGLYQVFEEESLKIKRFQLIKGEFTKLTSNSFLIISFEKGIELYHQSEVVQNFTFTSFPLIIPTKSDDTFAEEPKLEEVIPLKITDISKIASSFITFTQVGLPNELITFSLSFLI